MSSQFFNPDVRSKHFDALVDFARAARVPTGFGYLDPDGRVDESKPVELWITCRMTHIFSLAALMGDEGAVGLARHGVESLLTCFHDEQYGGWYSAIGHTQQNLEIVDGTKAAYAHAFVLLAASSASIANIEGGQKLLGMALTNQDECWWESEHAKVRESYDRSMTTTEAYRGANANMHTVEAYLAAFDATGDRQWLHRALAILQWFVNEQAAANDWRVPEHFDENWKAIPDYNHDNPADAFRPFGFTPGHGMEWARLALQVGAQLHRVGEPVPGWILSDAEKLIERGVEDSWAADDQPGFVYTVDRDGTPVVHERMHWVLCEATAAVTCLAKALDGQGGFPRAKDAQMQREALHNWVQQWWEYCESKLIERTGRWYHELDRNNHPSGVVWSGKPDIYHACQMLLLPDLPLAPTFARAIESNVSVTH